MFLGHMQIYQAWGIDYQVSFQVRMSIYLKIRIRLCYISYALDIGLPPVVWLQYYYTVDTIARNTHILANLHFAKFKFRGLQSFNGNTLVKVLTGELHSFIFHCTLFV